MALTHGFLTRSSDFNLAVSPILQNSIVFISSGNTLAGSTWVLQATVSITNPLTDNVLFSQFSASQTINAGSGLVQIGANLNVGAGTGITVNANDVQISNSYVGQTSITTLGTVSTGRWNGTTIAVPNGGTGNTSLTSGNVLLGNGVNPISHAKAAPTGNFVGTSDAQTLTNKIVQSCTIETSTTINDAVDPTKEVALDISGIAPGTTRTLIVPDANDTLTLNTATQTLNKQNNPQ